MDGPNGYSRHTVKARGAVANVSHRYTVLDSTAFDDGWDRTSWDDDAPPPLQTHVGIDHAKSIISRNQSPDVPFDRSVNPYRGCEHGCVYCFARPSHAYLGLSPGLDFETRLIARPDAPEVLQRELREIVEALDRIGPVQPGIETEGRMLRQVGRNPIGRRVLGHVQGFE
jgi:hypothetical protein